jgi:hypothetical protein
MVSSKHRGAAAVRIIVESTSVTMHELRKGIQTMPATAGWLSSAWWYVSKPDSTSPFMRARPTNMATAAVVYAIVKAANITRKRVCTVRSKGQRLSPDIGSRVPTWLWSQSETIYKVARTLFSISDTEMQSVVTQRIQPQAYSHVSSKTSLLARHIARRTLSEIL